MDLLQFIVLLFIAFMVWQQYSGKNIFVAKKGRKVILDTCALIDGRIIELSRAGFVPEELIVPEFIVHELQLLADGVDSHKRTRARFGLDIVKQLQNEEGYSVTIDKTKIPEKHAIDDKLIVLALRIGAPIYTTDFNLGKVASIAGVKVLNVNELAQHLRPTSLPGEIKSVKILQKGSNPKQGIGYMQDGTLMVVEGGAKYVGDLIEVEVIKAHQTAAGKMFFGEVAHQKSASNKQSRAQKKTNEPRMAARRPSRSIASRLKR